MKNIYIILALFIFSCGTSSKIKSESQVLKVVDISEYSSVYGMKTINEDTNEEYYIVSYKQGLFKERNFNLPISSDSLKIREGQSYEFKLAPIKPIVGKFQGLGAYIIVSKDTLLRAEDYTGLPISFISQNTVGLLIINTNPANE